MKKIIIAIMLISGVSTFGFKNAENYNAEKQVKLTVNLSFENIVEGYDHLTKTEVYIDGTLCGTSTLRNESIPNTVICTTSKGTHAVKVINYAYVDDIWEEHTIENSYSIDCKYEASMNLKKKNNKLNIIFDIDKGTRLK